MTPAKRTLDLLVVLLVLPMALPLMAAIALTILWRDGAPVLYASERMRDVERGFTLWKFRTMRIGGADNSGVTGADKAGRITATGRRLRALRLDELPQILNVLRGDISLVGPRPPLRAYVEAAPELYARVLRSRPGITGLATLVYHRQEAVLLAACATPAETHETYLRRCVPAKARLDLIYQRRANPCLDLWILWATLGAVLHRPARRANRR